MTRRAWTDIALSFARLRSELAAHAARARTDRMRHAHRERLIGVDLAARTICKTLRSTSSRFKSQHFMRIVTTGRAK